MTSLSCHPWGVSNRRERLRSARVYLVCDDREDGFVEAALRGGVDIMQLRMKAAGDEEILAAGRRLKRVCARHDTLLIINDRPDLAVAVDADGVHLGQDDTPVAKARAIVGGERLIGLSTHSPEQIHAAVGVDYIGVGPVNETPTKPGRPAVGLELVRHAAGHARLPFFAIGGISPQNVDQVRDAGARRIAVVRALTEAGDPEAVARELRTAIASGREARVGAA
jgi:thiamine-phosphate pyrophosphorylase